MRNLWLESALPLTFGTGLIAIAWYYYEKDRINRQGEERQDEGKDVVGKRTLRNGTGNERKSLSQFRSGQSVSNRHIIENQTKMARITKMSLTHAESY